MARLGKEVAPIPEAVRVLCEVEMSELGIRPEFERRCDHAMGVSGQASAGQVFE
jgi:hypothetical protein